MEAQHIIGAGGTHYNIEVGKPHPYLEPPPDGGQSMGVDTGFFTCNAFYAPPLDREIEDLSGTCVACGLHLTPDLLVPIFIFESTGGKGQWAIHAPLDATPEEAARWISNDTNVATFCLMETPTGIVRQIRSLGLDADFLRWAKAALQHVPHPADTALYGRLVNELGTEGLWAGAKKWVYNRTHDEFRILAD